MRKISRQMYLCFGIGKGRRTFLGYSHGSGSDVRPTSIIGRTRQPKEAVMSTRCPFCASNIPTGDVAQVLPEREFRLQAALASMGRKLRKMQRLLSFRTERLREYKMINVLLRGRIRELFDEKTPKQRAWNRKGTAGYDIWLRKFRQKNTPRIKTLMAVRRATA